MEELVKQIRAMHDKLGRKPDEWVIQPPGEKIEYYEAKYGKVPTPEDLGHLEQIRGYLEQARKSRIWNHLLITVHTHEESGTRLLSKVVIQYKQNEGGGDFPVRHSVSPKSGETAGPEPVDEEDAELALAHSAEKERWPPARFR
jgi:hypothetical protein